MNVAPAAVPAVYDGATIPAAATLDQSRQHVKRLSWESLTSPERYATLVEQGELQSALEFASDAVRLLRGDGKVANDAYLPLLTRAVLTPLHTLSGLPDDAHRDEGRAKGELHTTYARIEQAMESALDYMTPPGTRTQVRARDAAAFEVVRATPLGR